MEIRFVSACTEQQLSEIETLYTEAFPKEERKPFSLLIEKSREGAVDILCIESAENGMIGEAIVAKNQGLALLDYFAVSPRFRNGGAGSYALKALQDRYAEYNFILEIESTFHPAPDLDLRRRRKAFYLRNGMECMDYFVCLFGIEMEMLAHGRQVDFEQYHALYKNVFGPEIAENILLI